MKKFFRIGAVRARADERTLGILTGLADKLYEP
jgi:hypothetical protein